MGISVKMCCIAAIACLISCQASEARGFLLLLVFITSAKPAHSFYIHKIRFFSTSDDPQNLITQMDMTNQITHATLYHLLPLWFKNHHENHNLIIESSKSLGEVGFNQFI